MADADPKIDAKGDMVAAANVIETVEAPAIQIADYTTSQLIHDGGR